MTMVIKARNVNEAFSNGFFYLRAAGLPEDSRNGKVIVAPGPVITEYLRPVERVLWDERRLANPFFHLAECAWMLAGGAHVEWIAQFNTRMYEYADQGVINGAYGARWRYWFNGMDQIRAIYKELAARPNSRRAVIAMWDPGNDNAQFNDVPCNTTMYFDCREGRLNMTVCCRSNDILWGAYGANAVHMSFLQQLLAEALDVPVGIYRQFSNNFHAYTETADQFLASPPLYDELEDPYVTDPVKCRPMRILNQHGWGGMEEFLYDCAALVNGDRVETLNTFYAREVMFPMFMYYAERKWKVGDLDNSRINQMVDCDWKQAALTWIELKGERK